jgi:hypothetical protein
MRSGPRRWTRALALGCAIAALVASAAGAASQSGDTAIARAGTFVASDFPAGFESKAPPDTTHEDQIAMAKGVEGCGPYITIQKRLIAIPSAASQQFVDTTRTFGNEVGVFASDKAAASMLALFEKPSMVGCLENYLEKQFRRSGGPQVDNVTVELDRQDIAGLGDASVVYEGTAEFTLTNGTTSRIALGNASVRVGRTIDSVLYFTSGADVSDLIGPAVDASVSRLRSALGRSGS